MIFDVSEYMSYLGKTQLHVLLIAFPIVRPNELALLVIKAALEGLYNLTHLVCKHVAFV